MTSRPSPGRRVKVGTTIDRRVGDEGLKGLKLDDPRLASMSPQELRAAMRSLGYETQGDIAKAIGVNRSTVSLWLDGKVGVPRPVGMLLRMLVAAQRRPF